MSPLDSHRLSSYYYPLDESRIAQHPSDPADHSKLLVRDRDGTLADRNFYELPDLVDETRVMFFNDSKVIRSRLTLQGATLTTASGKQKTFDGEIFFLDDLWSGRVKCMVYPGDLFPAGGVIEAFGTHLCVEEIVYEGRILRLENADIWDLLETHGHMPLPPYIAPEESKEDRYQTVFADKLGSLAAPTASLHFTPRLLEQLDNKSISRHTVTLHVGLGTFKNIYEEDIRDYVMHAERIEVPGDIFGLIARYVSEGKTILAVGTTVARTLESLPYLWGGVREDLVRDPLTDTFWDSVTREKNPEGIISDISWDDVGGTIRFSSRIFIYPRFSWRIVGELVTNFHLPQSTLLMLVSSFLGLQETLDLYAYAHAQVYRFFSFGDAMYLRGENGSSE